MRSVECQQTNKHTNTHTHTHTHKHTYREKTEETFFYGQIFYFLFFLLYLFESIKRRFPIIGWDLLQPKRNIAPIVVLPAKKNNNLEIKEPTSLPMI